ncbi:transcriptional regulator [Jeotgalibaca porci]|uniref:Transcriptional regulator n=1 Tax=Jeotgalibaca porci TaxID=1868793 RepID=A0A6G7WG38_9LACT|nr:LCP family protein [Jeotgalibaca porci]QIK51216.1 transcriptional regulator [Jeotgalibaca porci]
MEDNRTAKFSKKRRNRKVLYLFIGIFLIGYTFFWKALNDVNRTSNNIFNSLNTNNKRESQVVIEATQPISFAFLGVDNGSFDRVDVPGRTDAILIGTVNPNTRTTTLTSIPRDTYALMVDYEPYEGMPYYDKMTHAYAFGDAEMAINSVQEHLNIPVDYYVEVNMQGLMDIVDALGGIEVTSPLTFDYQGNYFTEGETRIITGKEALAFSRMRKTDPEGDFGRQKREKLVIKAILDKALSLGTITNYESILETLEDNVKTNLTINDMTDMYFSYGKSLKNFETKNLVGEELWLDDIYYLYTYPEDRLALSNELRAELELPEITIDDLELSDVDYYNYEPDYNEEYYDDDSEY